MDFSLVLKIAPFISLGLFMTLKYAISSLFCGLPFGIILAISKTGRLKFIQKIANFYTAIFRGTPLFVQFSLIYYATPQVLGYHPTPFQAGLIAFSLNSAAYSSEVIRAGIQSIEQGQWEAAQVLGLSRYQTWRHIVIPQAFRACLPALINEMINLVKESAIVTFFGEMDIMRRAQIIAAEKFIFFEPYLLAACLYFSVVMVLASIGKFLERRYAVR